MVTNDNEEINESSVSTVVSAVISTLLVFILLGVASGFVYLYGRNNPGGLAERLASRLEAPYKRFGIVDDNQEENNNSNNNSVEMGSKPMQNNNTEASITFWENKDSYRFESMSFRYDVMLMWSTYLVNWGFIFDKHASSKGLSS